MVRVTDNRRYRHCRTGLSKILALSMGDIRTFSLPVMPAFAEVFISVIYPSRLAQQQQQLGKNCGDAMRLDRAVSSSRRNRRRKAWMS